ncbi:MAG: PorP/SprF family type IX secretion system membrane protein [Bacteroidia bacterium]
MKKQTLFVIMFFSCRILFAQDPHFTQYNNARTYTNPAFTGCDSTLNLSANYRDQWPAVNAYQSFLFSADKYVRCFKGGVGINFLQDSEMGGVITTSRVDLNYAAHIELCKHRLVIQPGIQVSCFQRHIDLSKLTFGDMIDERRGFAYSSNEVPERDARSVTDFSAGLLVHAKWIYGGIALMHFTEPDQGIFSVSKLPAKLVVHAGANIEVGNKNGAGILSPNILYMRQGDSYMFLPGLILKIRSISVGFSYRSEDAVIGTLAFQNRHLRVGYSYDYTVSKLTNKATGGSHEIGITWFVNFKKSVCTRNTLRLI